MPKRAFRSSTNAGASYPSLRDLARGPLSRWGLCALGGLLLGGGACTPVRGESSAEQTGTPPPKARPTPDAGAPSPLRTLGVVAPQRIDEAPPKSPDHADQPKDATKTAPGGKKASKPKAAKKQTEVNKAPSK